MKVKYKIGDYLYLVCRTQDTENWLIKKFIIKSVTMQEDLIIYNGFRNFYDKVDYNQAHLYPEFSQDDKEKFVFKTYSKAAKFLKDQVDSRFDSILSLIK